MNHITTILPHNREKSIRIALVDFFVLEYNRDIAGVAQGLEQAAHNRLVVGSNPTARTIFLFQKT